MRDTLGKGINDLDILKLKDALAVKYPLAMYLTGIRQIPYPLPTPRPPDAEFKFGPKADNAVRWLIEDYFSNWEPASVPLKKQSYIGDPIKERSGVELAKVAEQFKSNPLSILEAWKNANEFKIGLRIQTDKLTDGITKFRPKGTIPFAGLSKYPGQRVRNIWAAPAKNLLYGILAYGHRKPFTEKYKRIIHHTKADSEIPKNMFSYSLDVSHFEMHIPYKYQREYLDSFTNEYQKVRVYDDLEWYLRPQMYVPSQIAKEI